MDNLRKSVLELSELPERSVKLNPEEIEKVYGGCSNSGEICLTNKDCCPARVDLGAHCTKGAVYNFCAYY